MNLSPSRFATEKFQRVAAWFSPGFSLGNIDKPVFPGPLTEGDLELRKAVRNRKIDAIKLLLEHGVDPYKKDSSGMTVFQIVDRHDREIRTLLRDHVGMSSADRIKSRIGVWRRKLHARL